MKTNNTYNIIGDIHARTCWKNVVREDCINIFVGDYFDPYEYISPEEQMLIFREILSFKRQHPETVLLYGNHDLQYIVDERYSRYDSQHALDYKRLFTESQSLFHGIAYSIGNKALVSHAGVTKEWYEKYFGAYQAESLVDVAEKVNRLWEQNKQAFTFEANATEWGDCFGTSPTHSPLWIRDLVLVKHNLFAFTPVKQIVGHTQTGAGVTFDHNIINVDCLGTRERSYILEA